MRIDKYLWSIRVFKTRSKAAEACKKNQVSIGESTVKSSREVKIKDVIRVRRNQINYEFLVLDTPKSRVGAKLVLDFCKNVTPAEELSRLEMIRSSKNYYRQKGTGRPTKRDRRDLDTYFEEDDFDSDWDEIIKQ